MPSLRRVEFFTELVKLGTTLDYLDLGGGLGVDYDGSRSVCDSSRNLLHSRIRL